MKALPSLRVVNVFRNPADVKRGADGTDRGRAVARGLAVLLVALCVVSVASVAGTGVVTAQENTDDEEDVRGEPGLEAHLPSNTVVPGQTQELQVVVTNDGDLESGPVAKRNAVTKARNVRATLESEDTESITVDTGTRALGTVTEQQPRRTSFRLTVDEDTPPGEYDLAVQFEYAYTSEISQQTGEAETESATVTRTVTVEVDDDARFVVRSTSTTALIGDAGELRLEVQNVGDRTAYDASVRTKSTNGNVAFGTSASDETHAGTWRPGEVKTITHDVNVKSGSSVRPYTLQTTVSYDDEDGVTRADGGITSSITPLPEQTFTIEANGSTLRVDEEGVIRGTITNDGPNPVESVEVSAPLDDPNLYPTANSFAVGDLEPGESAPFRFHVDVGSEAEPLRTLVAVNVRYRTTDRERRVDDGGDVVVALEERRDEFLVSSASREIEAGASRVVSVELTNNLNETVTDIEPKLFTDDPLASPDDTAYVPELAPGETAAVRFEVRVDEGAIPKTYAASMDVRYTDADGTSKMTDTSRTAISVTEPDDDTNYPLYGGVIALLVGLVAAGYQWRYQPF